MAKPDPDPELTTAPAAVTLTLLDDWCRQRSAEAKQVELLAAFHADQVRQGHLARPAADFDAAFQAFRARPVED